MTTVTELRSVGFRFALQVDNVEVDRYRYLSSAQSAQRALAAGTSAIDRHAPLGCRVLPC